MLLRFGVENHGSIAGYQQLKLTATSLKDSTAGLLTVGGSVDPGKALKVLPVAGIYGANAAGKSTILAAFQTFCSTIVLSHTGSAANVGVEYFPFALDDSSKNKPSTYDVDIVVGENRYHYGYIVDGKKIVQEWLFSFDISGGRQVKTVLFSRETNDNLEIDFFNGKSLKGENKQIAKFLRPNSLFLSVAAQNSHPQLRPIYDFFYSLVAQRKGGGMMNEGIAEQISLYFGSDEKRRDRAIKFLKSADVGIDGIDFSKVPIEERTEKFLQDFEQIIQKHFSSDQEFKIPIEKERNKVRLLHLGSNGKKYPLNLNSESSGTLALLQLLGPTFARLMAGGLLVVDELNSTLHPLVSRELIKLFSNPETNPGKAQLIFTTHDTNLLTGGLMRRDQVWFAEKDERGATHLYSLSDIKVRADDNIERGYLMGRFGAIPFSGCNIYDFTSEFKDGSIDG